MARAPGAGSGANQPGWWREYGLGIEPLARITLPGSFYLGFEAEASCVQVFTIGYERPSHTDFCPGTPTAVDV